MWAWLENISQWFEVVRASRRAQLVATSVISGSIVAGTILSYQTLRRERRIAIIRNSIPDAVSDPIAHKIDNYKDHGDARDLSQVNSRNDAIRKIDDEDARSALLAARARRGEYTEELVQEQLARNRIFLTDEGLRKLRSAFVIVVGCGGVGSHAAAALARSGVSKLRLIDFDQVSLSSLNRHAVATLADVGTSKVKCMRKRLEQVAPWVHFDCRNELFSPSSASMQLESWSSENDHASAAQPPTFVIDAIDNIDSKVALLAYCHSHHLPVISSMGAGCKSDPTRIFVGDISSSTDDPLSRSVRRRLRLPPHNISSGIPVIYSTEKPAAGKAELQPLPQEEFEKGSVGDLGPLADFRVRILPVLGTMPAIFGMCLANYVMLTIAGYPQGDFIAFKNREKMYDGILASLQGSEERLAKWLAERRGAKEPAEEANGLRIPVGVDDVGYLVEEVFRGRSVVSRLPTRLALVRWGWDRGEEENFVRAEVPGQKNSNLRLMDLVCMTKDEALRHEKEVLKAHRRPEDFYDAEVISLLRQRKDEQARLEKYR